MSEESRERRHDEVPEQPRRARGEAHGQEAPSTQAPEPAAAEHPTDEPPAEKPVEALLGLRDFLAVAPRRASTGTTVAAAQALQRWMALQGHDVNGFYTMAEWQGFYADTMRYTG